MFRMRSLGPQCANTVLNRRDATWLTRIITPVSYASTVLYHVSGWPVYVWVMRESAQHSYKIGRRALCQHWFGRPRVRSR
jgi:hypothetical protein